MSNYLAVATVTATLRNLLIAAVSADLPGTQVTTRRPAAEDAMNESRINLFLYHVIPNQFRRNDELPARSSDGRLVARPRAALDLQYIVSFYGDELALVPQRLLGRTVRALHDQPLLTAGTIRNAIADGSVTDSGRFLAESDLADEIEPIRVTPIVLDVDDLSKMWAFMVHAPYALSVVYQVSTVFIEGTETPHVALPARRAAVHVASLEMPAITTVSKPGQREPGVAPGDLVEVQGSGLAGETTRVRIGAAEIAPETLSGDRLTFRVPSDLAAGIYRLRIARSLSFDDPQHPRTVESGATVILLRPRIVGTPRLNGTALTVPIAPPALASQPAWLILNESAAPAGRPTRSFRIAAEASDPGGAIRSELVFPVAEAVPGRYLLRVEVAGAQSLLQPEADGAFNAPIVELRS